MYTEEQVLELLISWDKSINPKEYLTCVGLDTIDFCDAALCAANILGLTNKFEELRLIRSKEIIEN